MSFHIALDNPKFPHNVGAALRAASAWGAESLWFSGERVSLEPKNGQRLPREERMKGYQDVALRHGEYPFDNYPDHVPIAVEVLPGAVQLQDFVHPENAVYVFGPEDGSIRKSWRRHCHQMVIIPTKHCLNLGAAINVVCYSRHQSLGERVPTSELMTDEARGWWDVEEVRA